MVVEGSGEDMGPTGDDGKSDTLFSPEVAETTTVVVVVVRILKVQEETN
jgi:hypothetical protein